MRTASGATPAQSDRRVSPFPCPHRPPSECDWLLTFGTSESSEDEGTKTPAVQSQPSKPAPSKVALLKPARKAASKAARRAYKPFDFSEPKAPTKPWSMYKLENSRVAAPRAVFDSRVPSIALHFGRAFSHLPVTPAYHPNDTAAVRELVEKLHRCNAIRPTRARPVCALYLRLWGKDLMDPWVSIDNERRSLAIDLVQVNQYLKYPSMFEYPSQDRWSALLTGRFFSKISLRSGYMRLRLQNDDRMHTAFKTPLGTYEWRVAPYGLATIPAYFRLAMELLFKDEEGVFASATNVYVHGSTKAERNERVARVRGALIREGGVAKDEHEVALVADCKSSLFVRGVKVTGGIVSTLPFRTDALYALSKLDDLLRQQALAELLRTGGKRTANTAEVIRVLEKVDHGDGLLSAVHSARSMISQALHRQAVPEPGLFALYVDFSSVGFGAFLSVEPIGSVRVDSDAGSSAADNGKHVPIRHPVAFLANVFEHCQMDAPPEVKLYLTIKHSLRILSPILDVRTVELRCSYAVEDVIADFRQRKLGMCTGAVLAERNVRCKYVSLEKNVVARALARVYTKSVERTATGR